MTTSKPLKPFFTYFGGKYRVARKYPAPDSRSRTIIEPFAGSAGYSLRYPDHDVIINDLDPVVAGTWEYLTHVSADEIRSLPLYDGTWEKITDLNLPQEQQWLIGWWLNKGTTAPSLSPSAWMRSTSDMGENYWGRGIRERIASQVDVIRHWKVSSTSFEDMPDINGTWFVDPPYEVAGKSYKKNDINYELLSEWCLQRKGLLIVCENEGAKWLPFDYFGDIKATAGRIRKGKSREVIFTQTLSADDVSLR